MELQGVINGCRAVEEAVATVYATFADLFPEEKEFWYDLYTDEVEHSIWMTKGSRADTIELLPSGSPPPSLESIVKTLEFVRGTVRRVKSSAVTLEEALRLALQIEESMVETFTNELSANLFASDYKSLSERIIAAEKQHISKIEDMMLRKGFLLLS